MKITLFINQKFCLFILVSVFSFKSYAQDFDVSIFSDSVNYNLFENKFLKDGKTYLPFYLPENNDRIDFVIKYCLSPFNYKSISKEIFSRIDSIYSDSAVSKYSLQLQNDVQGKVQKINILCNSSQDFFLMPLMKTSLELQFEEIELYQEEEKRIEIPAKNVQNIKIEPQWVYNKDFDYKLEYDVNMIVIRLKAHSLGDKSIVLPFKSIQPILKNTQLSNDLETLIIKFKVKANQLEYLNSDKDYVYFNNDYKYTEDIHFNNAKNLGIKKAYRIEDQAGTGGNLIAEMFTLYPVGNINKVLSRIRTFSLHHTEDGYLYVKENDRVRFVTNFNIIEKPKISKISILPEGGEWTTQLTALPGQKFEAKIEGVGLRNSKIHFDACQNIKADSLKSSDEALYFSFVVPIDIVKKKIIIFQNQKPTGFEILMKEYERPTEFDFIQINYGSSNLSLTNEKFLKPILHEGTIQDVNIMFNPNKIDTEKKLNGKQYLDIEVRILNNKNTLLDIQNITDIVVCPSESSPRYYNYDSKDCKQKLINLNEYLKYKTSDLEAFSQIQITFKHNQYKYGGQKGFQQVVNLIVKRKFDFDIQFAFPAGLYVKQFDKSGVGNLSGVSTSILAQLNFYHPKKIGKLLPYSVGIGFLGLNAFNFTDDTQRDAGVVILATINPLRKDTRFMIPLYFGGGYLIKANSWFLVFGPGIQFRF